MKINLKIYQSSLRLLLIAGLIGISSCSYDDGYRTEENIDESQLPQVDFTASSTTIFAGESVTFQNQTDGEGLLYTWTFEEGSPSTSNQPNPTVEYFTPGTYNVTLKVRNEIGANVSTREGFITVEEVPIQKQPQAPSVAVRLNFEENLGNEGYVDTDALTSGTISFVDGIINNSAFEFDGATDLTIPGYSGIGGNGARSISTWIKSSATETQGLVHWGESGGFSRSSFKVNSGGEIRFEWQGGNMFGTTNITDGMWHHVALSYDGQIAILYVDGVQEAISNVVLETSSAGETDVFIGSQAGGAFFTGTLDDVQIFDKAISPGEVQALANADQLAVRLNFETGLVNEGFTEDALSSGPQSFEDGIINEDAFVFDGATDLTIPGYSGVSGNGERSISTWIKTSTTATQGVVHWGESGSFSRSSFKVNSGGEIRFEWQGGNMFGTTDITDGEWHHVALSYDGDVAKLYVDGVEEATSGVVLDSNSAGETDVYIGSQAGGAIFTGSLDDVRIYESALSPETIAALASLDQE